MSRPAPSGAGRSRWTPLAVAYLVLALVGLVGTGIANVLVAAQMRDVLADVEAGGPFVTSISVDLGVTAVAGVVLLVVEGRRLGMRFLWLYVVLALVTAFGFAFPLFLCNRERLLAGRRVQAAYPGGP